MKASAIGALLFLAACQTAPQAGFCSIAEPTRLTDATIAAMTDAEVEKALAHNLKGQRLCSWVQ